VKLLPQLHGTDAKAGEVVGIGENAAQRQHGHERCSLPAAFIRAVDEVEYVLEVADREA
jgi:hypothetical protein